MGNLQRCFAVKPDINGLLDVARRTYSELIDDIQKIVEQLSETYDLPLKLNQNMMKGFHIVLPVAPKNRRNFNVESLPPIFIQVRNIINHSPDSRIFIYCIEKGNWVADMADKLINLIYIFKQVQNNGASVTMSTEELVVMDQQAKEALNEIQKMSNMYVFKLTCLCCE